MGRRAMPFGAELSSGQWGCARTNFGSDTIFREGRAVFDEQGSGVGRVGSGGAVGGRQGGSDLAILQMLVHAPLSLFALVSAMEFGGLYFSDAKAARLSMIVDVGRRRSVDATAGLLSRMAATRVRYPRPWKDPWRHPWKHPWKHPSKHLWSNLAPAPAEQIDETNQHKQSHTRRLAAG